MAPPHAGVCVALTVNHLRLIPGTLLPDGVSVGEGEGERNPRRKLLLSEYVSSFSPVFYMLSRIKEILEVDGLNINVK